MGKPDKGINHKLWSSYRAVHVTTIWTSQIRKNQSQVMVKLQSCTCYHNMGNHSQVMVNLQSSTCFNNMGKSDKAITHKLWSSYRDVHVTTMWWCHYFHQAHIDIVCFRPVKLRLNLILNFPATLWNHPNLPIFDKRSM